MMRGSSSDGRWRALRGALMAAALGTSMPAVAADGSAAPGASTIEARLKRMEDLEEIRRLRMMYHYDINEGQFSRIADLYTDDAYVNFQHIGGARGRDEIMALFNSIGTNITYIKQFIANHIVNIYGDNATGTSYFDARYAQAGRSIIAGGTYREKYRRTANGWRISEMISEIDFAGTVEEGWAGNKVKLKAPELVPRPQDQQPGR